MHFTYFSSLFMCLRMCIKIDNLKVITGTLSYLLTYVILFIHEYEFCISPFMCLKPILFSFLRETYLAKTVITGFQVGFKVRIS
jgi:hypothetical protein